MQLDPKREFLVNELSNIVEELSNYKPATQEQETAYYKAIWMLNSVVSELRKEDVAPDYNENLAKYDEFYAKLPPKYHEYAEYWNAWVGAYEAIGEELLKLQNIDKFNEQEWHNMVETFELGKIEQSADLLKATGTDSKRLLEYIYSARNTYYDKMVVHLDNFVHQFVDTFAKLTPISQLTCANTITNRWTNIKNQLIQYKTIKDKTDPTIEYLLQKQTDKQYGFGYKDLFTEFKTTVKLCYSQTPSSKQVGYELSKNIALQYPLPYAALWTLFVQNTDQKEEMIKPVVQTFINSLVLDEQIKAEYLKRTKDGSLEECMNTVRDICEKHYRAVVQLLPLIAAFYLNESKTSTQMYIVPSMLSIEDQEEPICVNKIALTKEFIKQIDGGDIEILFSKNANKDQVQILVSDIINGVDDLFPGQKKALIQDALDSIYSHNNYSIGFFKWLNQQDEQLQNLIIRALPRHAFARMLYELQKLPDFEPQTVIEPGTYTDHVANKLQEFKKFMEERITAKDRYNNYLYNFYTLNGFINQVCLNYEIYKSLDSVLEHFNGFATLYQNVNYSRDDFNGLDYRMVVSFDWNDSTVVATFQMDSKGKQNVSAGTNISQATGVAVAMPKGTMYTPQVLSTATADIIQTFPFLVDQIPTPVLHAIYGDTLKQHIELPIQMLTNTNALLSICSPNTNPDTYKDIIVAEWAGKMYLRCEKYAQDQNPTAVPEQIQRDAKRYFGKALEELQKIIRYNVRELDIGFVTPAYLRNNTSIITDYSLPVRPGTVKIHEFDHIERN